MTKRVYVAGHKGMVGSALVRRLSREADVEIITSPRSELDLVQKEQVDQFLSSENIDQIYLAAAKVDPKIRSK